MPNMYQTATLAKIDITVMTTISSIKLKPQLRETFLSLVNDIESNRDYLIPPPTLKV